jgi:predicted esterase
MIEHIPRQVDKAFLYFHSAGVTSDELKPFLPQLIEGMPNTYIWAGDGVIGGAPLMRQGIQYAAHSKRYWFVFPMQDASSPESFAGHTEAMGAVLSSAGAYVNALADQVMARFRLPASKVVLAGFQHGSCVALAASMLRHHDPFAFTILFEPYILEGLYLKDESSLPGTTVVCIDNRHIQQRTFDWIHIQTDREFQSFGMNIQTVTVNDGSDTLDWPMLHEAAQIMKQV